MTIWNKLNLYGHLISEPGLKIFFGNASFSPSQLDRQLTSLRVHQVHGHKIIEATPSLTQADAHWTRVKNTALLIQTADCMPAFLSNKQRSFVCALHIGWRGLAQKILTKSLETFKDKENLELWVGPHIKQKSFCLDQKSSQELLDPHGHPERKDHSIVYPTLHRQNQNSIDLQKILEREAQSLKINIKYFSPVNTYTSTQHHSHRRNPYGKGRQWSFICKV